VSKQCYWLIHQAIYSTRFGVRVCFVVLWSNNFQPPPTATQNLKISTVKRGFSYKKTPICCSHSSTKVVLWIGNIGAANPMLNSVSSKNKEFTHIGLSQLLKQIPLYFHNRCSWAFAKAQHVITTTRKEEDGPGLEELPKIWGSPLFCNGWI